MLLLALLLAASLVTVLAVLVECERQRRLLSSAETIVISAAGPSDEERFAEIVAPLMADPAFGRNL